MLFESTYLVTWKKGNSLQCCISKTKTIDKEAWCFGLKNVQFNDNLHYKNVFLLIQNMKYYWVLYPITFLWSDSKLCKESLCHQRCAVPTQHNVVSCKIACLLTDCAAGKWWHCIDSVPSIISLYVTVLHTLQFIICPIHCNMLACSPRWGSESFCIKSVKMDEYLTLLHLFLIHFSSLGVLIAFRWSLNSYD